MSLAPSARLIRVESRGVSFADASRPAPCRASRRGGRALANAGDCRVLAAVLEVGSTSRPRVLVADDHPVHRQWIRAVFEALACSVEVAENGAAALALCAVEAFDLVVIDRHMPVLGGDEAVRRLRADQGPSSLAYVASCSSDPPSDPAAGYDAIAPKPLDVDTACALLTGALTAAASRANQN